MHIVFAIKIAELYKKMWIHLKQILIAILHFLKCFLLIELLSCTKTMWINLNQIFIAILHFLK